MNRSYQTIFKNASVMMVTQFYTWGLAILLTFFLPRYLGATGIGQLQLGASIWAMVGVIAAFGMDALIIKEVARDPNRTGELFGNSALVRSAFFVLGAVAVLVYSNQAGYSEDTIAVILIIGIQSFFGYFSATTQSSLQGLERMEFSSLSHAVEKTFLTVGSIVLLLMGFRVIHIAVFNVVGSVLGLSIQFLFLRRIQSLKWSFNFDLIKWLLKSSAPYLMISSFIIIYGQIDTVVISLLVNESGVGLYAVTDRLIGTFLFVPTIFLSAIFPALSRMFVNERDSMSRLIGKSFDMMVLIAIPVGLGVFLIAGPLVRLLFGQEFARSGPILALRGVVTIFTYLNMLVGMFLISTDRQNAWTVVLAVATIATIPLDILFIPWCERVLGNGAMGGALSYLVTEALMFVAALTLLPKGNLTTQNAWYAARALLAGLVMVAATWWSRELFIAVPILVGALSYFVSLVLFRVLTIEDWHFTVKLFGSALQRFSGRMAQPASVSREG